MAKTVMNIIYLANMLIVLSKIQFSLQLSGGVCDDNGHDVCCYNFQNINNVCTPCEVGTISLQDGLCFPCKENKYGYKCLNYCMCNHSERCDAKLGCIRMTVTTVDAGNKVKYSYTSQNVTTSYLFRDKVSNREVSSNMDLIVYTLCVIGFLIITGLSHFVRSYRKRFSINLPRENREDIGRRPESAELSYIEIYDEIDEDLMGEDIRDTAVKPQLRNTNATVSNARTDKITSSHDDTSSYLDPCFTVEETDNKSSSSKESSSSHSSNCDLVIPDHTGYLNPYQPLRERQLISDGYEVTVHVHKDSDSSSRSESSEERSSSYKYSHVYQQLQKDQSTQNHEYEKATKTSNEMNIDLSEKNEIQDYRNKVSKDDKSIDLLNGKEAYEIDNEQGQFNADLFFGEKIGDVCRGVSEKSLNEDNYYIDYTDKSLNTDINQMMCARDCDEDHAHVQRFDISTDYLDMSNSVNTEEI